MDREKIVEAIQAHVKEGNAVAGVDALADRIAEALKVKGLSFPREYAGWRVEIKMGHEFKGTRGSTRRSRGYVARNITTGETQEFPPSAGHSAGFLAVKQWIDLKNKMEFGR